MMNWVQLLSLQKLGYTEQKKRKEENVLRRSFEVDYDRIIFSSAFRQLQDKTQVIPLPENGFVHNRLTHSLETASVGRSLGRNVGQKILTLHPELKTLGYITDDFGAIVAAAALAHDIGNPPFGHFGEKAIGNYFKHGAGQQYQSLLENDAQWYDLTRFEGNANGFNILMEDDIRLTYATLGTFTKYPKNAIPIDNPLKTQTKFGYFQQDAQTFEIIANHLGLISNGQNSWVRHPLAYLLEAADDICYSIIDFEDGLNLGWIDESFALAYLLPIIKNNTTNFKEKYENLTYPSSKFSYLRALTINVLIAEFSSLFITHEQTILAGDFNYSLLEKSHYFEAIQAIKNLTIKKVYENPVVLEIEASGHEIITGLLDKYCPAFIQKIKNEQNYYQNHLLKLIPQKYYPKSSDTYYQALLKICSYIASLTDKNAINLYKKLKGYNL